jgi:hypothetical protein
VKNRNGDWLHLYDCTYCRLRKVYKKAIDNRWEQEICSVTGAPIPAPRQGSRCCAHFKQDGCGCSTCIS